MNPSDSQPSKPKQTRRHYDDQFKRDTVALLEGGRSATQLSRELGVSLWNLRDWKRLFGTGGAKAAGNPPQAPLSGGTVETAVELADLRRRLETAERQRDILKKALAIVAQEPPNATR
jgi:transposase